MDPVFVKGIVAFALMILVFIGSVYLLLSMILGARLGYLVLGSCFFGVMILIALIWMVTALGPKGPETTWVTVRTGPSLSTIESEFGNFDVSSYPNGWVDPSPDGHLADLSGEDNTQTELENVKPVLSLLVDEAISPIPGIRKRVADQVDGSISLETGHFEVIDVRMKEAKVNGKDSIIAVGRAVSSATLSAVEFSNGAKEGTVARFLVSNGDAVGQGTPLVEVTTDTGTIALVSPKDGKLIAFGLRKGDKIKPGVPFAKLDVTGQPGAAEPALVAGVRVRGAVRTTALYYLAACTLLFALHMAALSRSEKARKTVPQPA
ncbi:MAG TPA: lipoyl domain-containing protein [Actinomycetota bacterium]|nr:lipoyl domain-containing protein [Actinomycetota bacterium]